MLTIAAMLFCLILALYWKLNVRKLALEPPRYPGELPLVGHSLMFIGDSKHIWNLLQEIAKKCKITTAFTFSIGFRKFYVLTDPDDLLLVANACLQKDVVYDFAKPALGNSLVTAEVSTWKMHRKLLNPVFNQKYMLDFLGVFNKQGRNLIKLFAAETDRASFDHHHYLHHIAMEAICKTTFGVDFSLDVDEISRYRHAHDAFLKIITERFLKVWLHNNFIWNHSSAKKTHDLVLKELHSISNMILKKRKRAFCANEDSNLDYSGKRFKPFLDQLFELKNFYGDEIFSDEVIREHIDSIIIAGHETVAGTLVYTILLIGSYPDVQAKIYTELQDVFGESDRDLEKEDLSRLLYLEAVLKESMRLYPVAPVIARIIDKDIKLKNYTLYAGNTCAFMINGAHKHAMWGDDAEHFKPERWLEQTSLTKNPDGFIAFSLGRRVCIGKTFAMYFMKTVMSHVMRHYIISGNHHKTINKLDVMLRPASGHHISLQRRYNPV